MPKVKLKKLDKYDFTYKTTLRISDINYGGHLGNDSLISIVHDARIDLLKKLGCTELNLGDSKTGIIMADLAANYIKEGFMFDELTIYSRIDEIKSASFRIFHNVTKNDETLALVETGIITFDYKERAIAEIPESFLASLEKIN